MQIKIKSLTGRELEINVESVDTVEQIKELVEQKDGIAISQQRLIFLGKSLPDNKTVEECGFKAGSVIHLVLALRGGGYMFYLLDIVTNKPEK